MDALLQRVEPYLPLACLVRSLEKGVLPPQQCFLALLSKVLGYAIIAGATILKLPQIILILQKRSTEGLATSSFEIETVGFTIALSYCRFKGLAFSAYGEVVFLLIQDIILVLLCYYYAPKRGPSVWLKTALYAAIAPVLIGGQISAESFELLYACQHAVFIIARLPQLYKNYKQKSTGQLSFSSSFLQFGGILARLFTSIQEKAPSSSILPLLYAHGSRGVLRRCHEQHSDVPIFPVPKRTQENDEGGVATGLHERARFRPQVQVQRSLCDSFGRLQAEITCLFDSAVVFGVSTLIACVKCLNW
ncbi:hypothetical protein KFL_002750170 [Klebsormidium nitens]|uniref:Mannose-P-dolichol utilization defect 1 protein homolog n=1 Tax=Klebsormidium nitens TaxID=105231 RepID=A0A1Y1I5G6_KLENI|nr:hypothetical protein KFL_002750170 [Klebsormidium nitens]|eukprot:GAQ86200.1 hypothetical protein KFL_002750170 [Klebsormidium nitens]